MIIHTLAVIGFVSSAYYLYIRNKLKTGYKPVCDISENISCSKAIESEQSTVFVLPNALLGLFYYIIVFILAFVDIRYVFFLSIPATLFTVYLVFISFRMRNFCIICGVTNVINFLITILSYTLNY